MYFIISSKYFIHNACAEKHDIYKMILDTLQNSVSVPVNQVNTWDGIDKPNYYYLKKDNEIELRHYKLESGYISEYICWSVVERFYISDFSTPEINIFVEQLKDEIKKRYNDKIKKIKSFSEIKK